MMSLAENGILSIYTALFVDKFINRTQKGLEAIFKTCDN
jgi:hypothetical protein